MITRKPKVSLKGLVSRISSIVKKTARHPIISTNTLRLRKQGSIRWDNFVQVCKTAQGKPAIAQLYLNALEKNPKFFIKIPGTSTIILGKWRGEYYDFDVAKNMIHTASKIPSNKKVNPFFDYFPEKSEPHRKRID